MSTPTDYFDLAEAYAGGVRSLLTPSAGPAGVEDRGLTLAPAEQLAARAEGLLPVSGGLNGAASERLSNKDPVVRADAELKLLAKAATDLEVAALLYDIAKSEGERASSPEAGAAAAPSFDRAGGGAGLDVEENLETLLSRPSAAALAETDRGLWSGESDADTARADALTQVGDTLKLISMSASKSGRAALGGLIGLGAVNVAGALGQAVEGLANVLGVGDAVSRLYSLVQGYAVNAYNAVMALLGSAASLVSQKVVEWVDELKGKWVGELKEGELLGRWLEKLYETEATKQAVAELAGRSTADAEKFGAVAEEARRLRESYAKAIKWADKVLGWVPKLSGPVALAMPHGTVIVVVLYVALGGYVIMAGADYVDAPRLKILNRVPGVREVAEGMLA